MGELLVAAVGAETVFGDGRRVGCSAMVVAEAEISVLFSFRRWPDDQSERQLRWQVVDVRSGRTLTPSGGGYGGGAKPDEPRDLDGSWRFSGSAGDRTTLMCSLGDREILNLDVPIVSAPMSSHHLVVRSAQHRPRASERELFVQVRSRWPPERAAADRIEVPTSSVDLSGNGMEIIAIEDWAGVVVLVVRFPDEVGHTGVEGLPVWWHVEIDGVGTNAVLFSSTTGASGLLAWLVLADNRSPGTSTGEQLTESHPERPSCSSVRAPKRQPEKPRQIVTYRRGADAIPHDHAQCWTDVGRTCRPRIRG